MGPIDGLIFDEINKWPQSWSPFLKFFSVALSMGWVKVGFGLMLLVMLWRNPLTRKAVLCSLIAIGMANTLTNVFKEGLPMNRPFQDMGYVKEESQFTGLYDHLVFLRVGHSNSKGTASAHSANMAALAFTMCYFLRRWGLPWIGVAFLTGVSRVYTGAHYPSQVLLGWLCGIFAAFVVIKTLEAWQRSRNRIQLEVPDEKAELA